LLALGRLVARRVGAAVGVEELLRGLALVVVVRVVAGDLVDGVGARGGDGDAGRNLLLGPATLAVRARVGAAALWLSVRGTWDVRGMPSLVQAK
jgi:hypothetical protein